MVSVCSFWGTRSGCKRGKRCKFLHIEKDSGVVNNHFERHSRSLRSIVLGLLSKAGSETEIGKVVFGFEKKQTVVKIQVRSRQASSAAYAVRHSGGFWQDDGTWFCAAGADPMRSQDIYHCTSVDGGWNILEQNFIRNSVDCSPQGVYGTADLSNSWYDCGATIVMTYVGAVCSVKQSKQFPGAVKPGLILCYQRSVKEWIADEAAVEIKEVWFEVSCFLSWLRDTKGVTRVPSEVEAEERAEPPAKKQRIDR